MKKLATICSLVVLLIGVIALSAQAIPITGDISFSGSVTTDSPIGDMTAATKFLTYPLSVVSVTGGAGSFSPLLSGNVATFTPFGFRAPNTTVGTFVLWTIIKDGITYSWDATSLAVLGTGGSAGGVSYVTVGGSGLAHINAGGFDATAGTWNLTASSSGATFTFANSNSIPVPEPSTLMFLGLGLLSLVGITRKITR